MKLPVFFYIGPDSVSFDGQASTDFTEREFGQLIFTGTGFLLSNTQYFLRQQHSILI